MAPARKLIFRVPSQISSPRLNKISPVTFLFGGVLYNMDVDVAVDHAEPEKVIDNAQDVDQAEQTGNKKKKKIRPYHRIHAHRNPLADAPLEYPASPETMDWSKLYPKVFADYEEAKKTNPELLPPQVQMADIGCGYGGLSIALARLYPTRLTLGMEIRKKVVQYVNQRLGELHELKYDGIDSVPKTGGPHPIIEIEQPDLSPLTVPAPDGAHFAPLAFPMYHNVAAIETNAMKFLPNFFYKGQLDKIFFLFPDPHFKKTKYRLRIINSTLLAEYAYVLRLGGIAYIATDVKDLFDWMASHFDEHPLFQRISDEETAKDPVVPLICGSTEESRKVRKQGGSIWHATWRRVEYSGKDFHPANRD